MTGVSTQKIAGVNVQPANAPLKCSTDRKAATIYNNTVCQFPFKLNGVIKWDCVEAGAKDGWIQKTQVCNVKESTEVQEFDSVKEFHECGSCSSSVTSGQFHFEGFPLANEGGSNTYSRIDSKEECQELCDLVQGCNFFVYKNNEQKCFLKFGVGKKVWVPVIYFGASPTKG